MQNNSFQANAAGTFETYLHASGFGQGCTSTDCGEECQKPGPGTNAAEEQLAFAGQGVSQVAFLGVEAVLIGWTLVTHIPLWTFHLPNLTRPHCHFDT